MDVDISRDLQLIGGKLLGEGAYGCVFDKPLECKSELKMEKAKGHVGKLALKKQALTELKESMILGNIPGAEKYFVIINNQCALKPRKYQTEVDLKLCTIAQEKPYDNFVQLMMPYGGKSLASLKKGITSRTIDFGAFGTHLLEASALLLSNGIVHYDFHNGNILVKDARTPIIIDFGLSWQSQILSKGVAEKLAGAGYAPEYGQYSPELSIVEAMEEGIKLSDRIYRDILEKKGTWRLLEKLYGIPFEKTVSGLREFAEDSMSVKDGDWLKFYSTYWPKFDAWALGRILINLYQILVFDPQFKPNQTYNAVIKGLLNSNPRRRLNAAQALKLWNPASHILKNPAIAKWL